MSGWPWVIVGIGFILLSISEICQFLGRYFIPVEAARVLFLGCIAISAPYFAEWLKKKYLAPDLDIEYEHKPPYIRKTYEDNTPVYYAQFRVWNKGKSQAKSCEAVLEELWISDERDRLQQVTNFLPINLTWSTEFLNLGGGSKKSKFVNINRDRKMFCNIGHIPSPNLRREESVFYKYDIDDPKLLFVFDIVPKLNAQPDGLLPKQRAKIRVGVYAENAVKKEKEFHLKWSGVWKEENSQVRKQIEIRPVKKADSSWASFATKWKWRFKVWTPRK